MLSIFGDMNWWKPRHFTTPFYLKLSLFSIKWATDNSRRMQPQFTISKLPSNFTKFSRRQAAWAYGVESSGYRGGSFVNSKIQFFLTWENRTIIALPAKPVGSYRIVLMVEFSHREERYPGAASAAFAYVAKKKIIKLFDARHPQMRKDESTATHIKIFSYFFFSGAG